MLGMWYMTVLGDWMWQVAEASDVLILAVKPQIVEKVATELKPSLSKNHLLISIAAGVTLVNLQRWAGEARVVRVMPNLPCLVGATAAVGDSSKLRIWCNTSRL
jgi:pyrroline-5-carboxylate reductase